MGIEELRELLDLGAIEQVEASLRPTPRNVDELHDLLRRAGPLLDGEYDRGFAETLLRERRAIRARLEDAELLVAVEDAGLVRDAFGVVPPGGVPQVFLESVEGALRAVLRRYAKTHGPFTTAEVASRFLLDPARIDDELAALERDDELVRGELRPGGTEREWCDPDVLRRIRRATLAVLRREVEPAEQAAFGRFLPAWHGIGRRARSPRGARPAPGRAAARDALGERRAPAARADVPARRIWTCSARPARWSGSAPASTASPCTSATTRRCSVRRRRRRLRRATSRVAIRAALAERALFWADLVDATGALRRGRAARGSGSSSGRER